MLVPRPTTLEQYTLQPEIVKKILRYATQPSILHTVLCGPYGCGKYSLCLLLIAQHMGVSLAELHRVHPHSFTFQDKEHTFYKSAHHFEIDVQHFQPHHQKAIVEIVRDLSKTMNVALNRYKIIVLRNSECLTRNVQHQLRRIVETLYRTARLIFICHNIDNLDVTIRSRFMEVFVPAPSVEAAKRVLQTLAPPAVTEVERGVGEADEEAAAAKSDTDNAREQEKEPDAEGALSAVGEEAESRVVLHDIVRACDCDVYFSALALQMQWGGGVPNELDAIADTLWELVASRKNSMLPIRKMLRDVSVTQVPWKDVLCRVLRKLYVALEKQPDLLGEALHACCYYTYLHEISHRKEIQLELLVLGLHELMRCKRISIFSEDWV